MNLKHKYRNLAISLAMDIVGFIPIPFFDLIWAPVSGYAMTRMYKGETGKVAGIITFIEEILPGTDFIPTFTLMWLYTYVFQKSR